MSPTTAFRSLVAGSTSLVLGAAGVVALTTTAGASTSHALSYSCSSPALGAFTATATHTFTGLGSDAEPGAPDLAVYGGDLAVDTTLTLSEGAVEALRAADIQAVTGEANRPAENRALLAGVPILAQQSIDDTTFVPASGPMDLVASGKVNLDPAKVDAGDTADLAMADDAGIGFTASLATYTDNHLDSERLTLVCEPVDGQDLAVGLVTIQPALTEISANDPFIYDRKGNRIRSGVAVWSLESAAIATGEVTMILKRNGRKIDERTKLLKAYRAWSGTLMWTNVPGPGRYRLIATYHGNGNFTGSRTVATKTYE